MKYFILSFHKGDGLIGNLIAPLCKENQKAGPQTEGSFEFEYFSDLYVRFNISVSLGNEILLYSSLFCSSWCFNGILL